MRRIIKHVVLLATVTAAMAACAEPTSPRTSNDCGGGGSQTWEKCVTVNH
jgi:hypothetical protein